MSWYQRHLRQRPFAPVLTWLLHLLSLACLTGVLLLQFSNGVYLFLADYFGGGFFGSVVAEFHAARDGAGMLYTQEHFQAIRELLSQCLSQPPHPLSLLRHRRCP